SVRAITSTMALPMPTTSRAGAAMNLFRAARRAKRAEYRKLRPPDKPAAARQQHRGERTTTPLSASGHNPADCLAVSPKRVRSPSDRTGCGKGEGEAVCAVLVIDVGRTLAPS